MRFAEIQDQSVPIRLLQNILRQRRIPNGLLFWGPGGVGKRQTALAFAKAINCKEDAGDACGECLSCKKIDHANHPDVKIITPAGRARNIGVDAIDFINELAAYRPFESDWRLVILLDAERMREPAQNHFLKTLEEPPSNTVFILATEFPRTLLPTIRSRCQQVRFAALRPQTVANLLRKERDLAEDTAQAIASIAQGQMSRAFDLVDTEKRAVVLDITGRLNKGEDPLLLSEEFSRHLSAQRESIKAAAKAELALPGAQESSKEDREEHENEQIAFIEALIRREQMEYIYLLQTWYRDVLIYHATGGAKSVLNRDQTARLSQTSGEGASEKIAAIEKAWVYIERNLSIDRVFRDLFFVLAA